MFPYQIGNLPFPNVSIKSCTLLNKSKGARPAMVAHCADHFGHRAAERHMRSRSIASGERPCTYR